MINGISIPVLTPFKFYPASVTTGDGVNFQNVDNTELHNQDWEGVYPNRFVQPVPRFWNDYSPGIDFQILNDSVQEHNDTTCDLVDLYGNVMFTLIKESFMTLGTQIQTRFYADEFHIDDGCYILVLKFQDVPIFNSEVINIADTHEDTYPLEYSNFENDFGLIFTNGSAETWTGKILIPMRMFRPATEEEREVYNNDVGELTTLRAIPKRIYIIESLPVSNWFAEQVKLMFDCSDLLLNKSVVNSESGVQIDPLNETDKMEITGNIQLNDFTEGYLQEENIDTVTELITGWTPVNWDTFDASGKDIREAEADEVVATMTSNSIAVTEDQWYLIQLVLLSYKDSTPDFDIGADSNTLTLLENTEQNHYYLYKAPSTTSITIVLTTLIGDYTFFEGSFSMKKIS